VAGSSPLTTFGVAVALAVTANASGAAPLSYGRDALARSDATLNLVEQVHGTYRACVRPLLKALKPAVCTWEGCSGNEVCCGSLADIRRA